MLEKLFCYAHYASRSEIRQISFHPNLLKPTLNLPLLPIHLKFQIQIIINPQILRS